MAEMAPTWDTVVIGGGMAGLAAAITAAGHGHRRVLLLDEHPLGGRARADLRSGFTFNRGPRALYVDGPADRFLRSVGVATSSGGPPWLRGAGAIADGQVERFPGGPAAALSTRLLTASQKVALARVLPMLAKARPGQHADQTVAAWLDQRALAGRPRQVVEALVRVNTYAHAPDRLAAGPALANVAQSLRSGVRYLDGGWQPLVEALAAEARRRGVEFRTAGARSVHAPGQPGGGVAIDLGSALVTARTAVIAAGGPATAARLLGGAPSSWPPLGPPARAACLELGLHRPPRTRFVLGIDEPTYGSTHGPPARLGPDGTAVVHVMRYLAPDEHLSPADARGVLDRTAAAMGIGGDDVLAERFLPQMEITGALPTPSSDGQPGRVPVVLHDHPAVFLAGDWVGATGMLLDAAVASGIEAGSCSASVVSGTMVT